MTDESNAFKNMINAQVVKKMGQAIKDSSPTFKAKLFEQDCKDLAPLELKARVLLLAKGLKSHLPQTYKDALSILTNVLNQDKLTGFELWPFSEYIGQNGLNHFSDSLKAMDLLTTKFTSEFAVRPYLLKDHNLVLKHLLQLASSKNHHHRRFASEGSRPLLPWGAKIPALVKDPNLTLPILEKLKWDEELYVRKSVSNHLNDISKHHPAWLIKLLTHWKKVCPKEHLTKYEWIKKQALRTLIKKGDKDALKLMGVSGKALVKIENFKLNQKNFKLHDKLYFSFEITSTSKSKQEILIDYKIHFVKAKGKIGDKTFKLKKFSLDPQEKIKVEKNHSLKPITTMVYYPGIHKVSLQINGEIIQSLSWKFLV